MILSKNLICCEFELAEETAYPEHWRSSSYSSVDDRSEKIPPPESAATSPEAPSVRPAPPARYPARISAIAIARQRSPPGFAARERANTLASPIPALGQALPELIPRRRRKKSPAHRRIKFRRRRFRNRRLAPPAATAGGNRDERWKISSLAAARSICKSGETSAGAVTTSDESDSSVDCNRSMIRETQSVSA